jgi:hypothetical protein
MQIFKCRHPVSDQLEEGILIASEMELIVLMFTKTMTVVEVIKADIKQI